MAIAKRVQSRFSVGARWTEKLIEDGYTPVSDIFLRNYGALKISTAEAMFLIHLISFKWDEKRPFPSLKTIAGRMNMSPTAVRSHVRRLEKGGLIQRVKRSGATNEFDLTPLFSALENLTEGM
jgi:DNA-binding MarR family transcriptional regulator